MRLLAGIVSTVVMLPLTLALALLPYLVAAAAAAAGWWLFQLMCS